MKHKKKRITIMKGVGASEGKARGKALLIQEEELIKGVDIPGYEFILIAPYTMPTIVPLLLRAQGVVCERGGLTTHAAIVSRELGIACVVGVAEILKTVKPGVEIEVDGKKGEVIIYA